MNNNDELEALRRDIRYAALPGKMSAGCLTLLLFLLAGCGVYAVLFLFEFFWELSRLPAGGH
jgi:hypothetical protein